MAADYLRRISSEEAREGYILVEKSRLKFLPPIGQPFELTSDGKSSTARVEARDCECRGPDKPHQHYFIRFGGMEAGARVRLSMDGAGYRLERA